MHRSFTFSLTRSVSHRSGKRESDDFRSNVESVIFALRTVSQRRAQILSIGSAPVAGTNTVSEADNVTAIPTSDTKRPVEDTPKSLSNSCETFAGSDTVTNESRKLSSTAEALSSKRARRFLKPSSFTSLYASAVYMFPSFASSKSSSISASISIVASFFERIAMSKFSSRVCLTEFFVISPMWSLRLSMSPYCFSSSVAVFSPIFGTPGILSEESPIRPLSSII